MAVSSQQISICIAGNAGQGIMSSAVILAKAFAKTGLYVLANSEYPSLIRGGHNFIILTVAHKKVTAPKNELDLLLGFNLEAVEKHYSALQKNGVILIDTDQKIKQEEYQRKIIQLPFGQIAQQAGGLLVMKNMACLGALLGLLDYPLKYLQETTRDLFQEKKRKKKKIIQLNQKIAKAGFNAFKQQQESLHLVDFDLQSKKNQGAPKKLLNGNEAITQGLITGKLNFYSAYPMTPASDILHCLARQGPKKGITVIQPEDEIASINMAVGASYAGARSATATSGGGFCLMTEALGLAGCAEIPLVVINCQRPGPSTGLPTRTEQGDLLFSLSASQGEFPRVVLAPGNVEECFLYTQYALNLAQIYQLPVIILSDKYLASTYETVDRLIKIPLKQGKIISDSSLTQKQCSSYKRYQWTTDHISARALPGQKIKPFTTTSNEHNQYGQISEDPKNRIKMMKKRMGKMKTLLKQEKKIEFYKLYRQKENKILLIGWGSTKGIILQALKQLNKEKIKTSFLQMIILEPAPWKKIHKILKKYTRLILIENNFSGQLGRLIQEKTGVEIKEKLLRYDGRPWEVKEIINTVKDL